MEDAVEHSPGNCLRLLRHAVSTSNTKHRINLCLKGKANLTIEQISQASGIPRSVVALKIGEMEREGEVVSVWNGKELCWSKSTAREYFAKMRRLDRRKSLKQVVYRVGPDLLLVLAGYLFWKHLSK